MPVFVDPSPPGVCIFCRLIAGEIPTARVYEDEQTFAFLDMGQLNPGHTLIAVKRHATTLLDLTPAEAAAAMRTTHRVSPSYRRMARKAIRRCFISTFMLFPGTATTESRSLGHGRTRLAN